VTGGGPKAARDQPTGLNLDTVIQVDFSHPSPQATDQIDQKLRRAYGLNLGVVQVSSTPIPQATDQ